MLQNMLQNRSLQDEQTCIRRHATSCSTLKHMKGFFMKNVADALRMLQSCRSEGALAELVYALVLGTSVFGHESSSLLRPTKSLFLVTKNILHFSFLWVSAKFVYDFDRYITFRMLQTYMPTRLRI